MRLGFALPVSGPWATPENQVTVAQAAERLGYDSVWTFQRLLYPVDDTDRRWVPAYRSVADPLVTLAYVAGVTDHVRLGVGVVNMPWYSPVVLAKMLTSLDVVSHGRLDAGLGLGWAPEEYAATGTPMAGRGRRAEEFLRCLYAVWGADPVVFHGEHYRVPESYVAPKPVQSPHPPVLLGGFAEAALSRAGRLADGWISSARADVTVIGASIRVVRRTAEAAGRDPGRLRFACRAAVRLGPEPGAGRKPLHGTADQVRDDVAALADQGVTEAFVDLNFDPDVAGPRTDAMAAMDRAGQALEAFAPVR